MKAYYKDNWVTIYNMDCIEGTKQLEDESIDLVILDPPYITTNQEWDKEEVITNEFIVDIFRILKETGNLYVWCGIGEISQSLIRWFPMFNKKFIFKDLITWKKQRGIGMKKGWLYTREEIMWFVKNNKKFTWNKEYQYGNEKRKLYGYYKNGIKMEDRMKSSYKRLTNVWTDIIEITFSNSKEFKSFNKLHYAPKPLKAIERIILLHTQENYIVLDPFLGSGTTAKGCKNLNRKCIAFETKREYCDVSIERIRQEKLF